MKTFSPKELMAEHAKFVEEACAFGIMLATSMTLLATSPFWIPLIGASTRRRPELRLVA